MVLKATVRFEMQLVDAQLSAYITITHVDTHLQKQTLLRVL